jgi:hypothetical protein
LSPLRPTRGLPTSRAFWELKADQMMNRVFAPEAPIDLDPLAPHRPLPPVASHGPRVQPSGNRAPAQQDRTTNDPSALTVLLLAALGGVGLVGALSTVLLVQQWAGLQRSLSQERSLLLVERLRALGPATIANPMPVGPATPPAPVLAPPLAVGTDLPPPPPEEAWMEQLPQLPVSRGLTMPAPPATSGPAATSPGSPEKAPKSVERFSGPLPQLVGLVGAPGQAGSAIFQMGDTSTNVNVGEPIGSSGWRLKAADGDSALIERGTDVRRIAIVAGG